MAGVRWLLLLLFLVPLLSSSIAAQDCDTRCSTKNCNDEGVCICDLPANSTVLQGNRHFMGGEYCETPQTMCDGSNTFYCENGLCNEIIQGENYTCICKEGYGGDHCELEGTSCGDFFCYHNGECNEGDGSCDCPADWRGSGDCSTRTVKSSTSNPTVDPIQRTSKDSNTWYLPVFVAIAVVALAGGVVLGVKSIRKRSTAATEFHKLRQVQMRGFIDEDEDAFAHAPLSKAELA